MDTLTLDRPPASFDAGHFWDALPPATQRSLGIAAVLFANSERALAAALDAEDMRRARFFEVACGVGREAMDRVLDPLLDAARMPFPDLAPWGVQQCTRCGCIEEVACRHGCAWVTGDLCSACADREA